MDGPFTLKTPLLLPISGPLHMLFLPHIHPQLPSSIPPGASPPPACLPGLPPGPGWALLLGAMRLVLALSSLPVSLVINCQLSICFPQLDRQLQEAGMVFVVHGCAPGTVH